MSCWDALRSSSIAHSLSTYSAQNVCRPAEIRVVSLCITRITSGFWVSNAAHDKRATGGCSRERERKKLCLRHRRTATYVDLIFCATIRLISITAPSSIAVVQTPFNTYVMQGVCFFCACVVGSCWKSTKWLRLTGFAYTQRGGVPFAYYTQSAAQSSYCRRRCESKQLNK